MLRPNLRVVGDGSSLATFPAGPAPAPPRMRPGELARAKSKLMSAARGHRDLAAHHRAESEKAKASVTASATPKAKRDRGDGVTAEDAPAAAAVEPPIEGGQHSHTTMAEVHEIAAAELQAKAEALR